MRWFGRKQDQHVAPALLSEYLDGRLKGRQAEQVRLHLEACQGCREELESLRATVALLKRMPVVAPQRSFVLRERPVFAPKRMVPVWAMGAAASLVLLAFVAVVSLDVGGVLSTHGGASPKDSFSSLSARIEGTQTTMVAQGTTPGNGQESLMGPLQATPGPAAPSAGPQGQADQGTAPGGEGATITGPEDMGEAPGLETGDETALASGGGTPTAWRYLEGVLAGIWAVLIAVTLWIVKSRRGSVRE